MRQLAHWLRHIAFVCSGSPEITPVELWLRAQDAPALNRGPEAAEERLVTVAVPFEFQSVVSLADGWPHWPVVHTAA